MLRPQHDSGRNGNLPQANCSSSHPPILSLSCLSHPSHLTFFALALPRNLQPSHLARALLPHNDLRSLNYTKISATTLAATCNNCASNSDIVGGFILFFAFRFFFAFPCLPLFTPSALLGRALPQYLQHQNTLGAYFIATQCPASKLRGSERANSACLGTLPAHTPV